MKPEEPKLMFKGHEVTADFDMVIDGMRWRPQLWISYPCGRRTTYIKRWDNGKTGHCRKVRPQMYSTPC